MSRKKKFKGKPPWVGKTKEAVLRKIEDLFNPNVRSRNGKSGPTWVERGWRARRIVHEAAKRHPVDSRVELDPPVLLDRQYAYGTVARIRGGRYVVKLDDSPHRVSVGHYQIKRQLPRV